MISFLNSGSAILIIMGNSHEGKITPIFHKHCHRQLSNGIINEKQQTIELRVCYDENYHQWRWNLYPLMTYQKHLMLPKYFHDRGANLYGCQTQNKKSLTALDITVGYDPFVYTLENEVMARMFNGKSFTEKEVWKIMKGYLLGLRCWVRAYPDLPLSMDGRNILFDSGGHCRIAHIFSFPPDDFVSIQNRTMEYTELNPRNVLLKDKKGQNPQLLANSIRELGQVLSKIGQNVISPQLRQVIEEMVHRNQFSYQRLQQLIQIASTWNK